MGVEVRDAGPRLGALREADLKAAANLRTLETERAQSFSVAVELAAAGPA